jgi:hypothetical protein
MTSVPAMVARWFVFKPKIQIWVHFGGSCKDVGIVYGHLVHFTVFYIFYGHLVHKVRGNLLYIYFPVLVFCTKKNLATLVPPCIPTYLGEAEGDFKWLLATCGCKSSSRWRFFRRTQKSDKNEFFCRTFILTKKSRSNLFISGVQ